MSIVNKILQEGLQDTFKHQKLLLSRSITSFQLCKDNDYTGQEHFLNQIKHIKQKLISLGMTESEIDKFVSDFSLSEF